MPQSFDFELAQQFLEQAREAFAANDEKAFVAARYMLMILLGVRNG